MRIRELALGVVIGIICSFAFAWMLWAAHFEALATGQVDCYGREAE